MKKIINNTYRTGNTSRFLSQELEIAIRSLQKAAQDLKVVAGTIGPSDSIGLVLLAEKIDQMHEVCENAAERMRLLAFKASTERAHNAAILKKFEEALTVQPDPDQPKRKNHEL
ncbi:MAG: hypothetical protein MJH10_09475 [Epibacterium sp.]|nr:hypothetical protein [Epibacterium sp.]MCJ8334455.1 hypothetical protein [Epibacterium sp.]NQX73706.1 hypothetical protein [Epibacterium sp.]NQX73765.1 hypothetical protein [Epibacterium sp.]